MRFSDHVPKDLHISSEQIKGSIQHTACICVVEIRSRVYFHVAYCSSVILLILNSHNTEKCHSSGKPSPMG
jgi:hypothetical protein